jgi:hypothetical protein
MIRRMLVVLTNWAKYKYKEEGRKYPLLVGRNRISIYLKAEAPSKFMFLYYHENAAENSSVM